MPSYDSMFHFLHLFEYYNPLDTSECQAHLFLKLSVCFSENNSIELTTPEGVV
jgi:hypothetical protein